MPKKPNSNGMQEYVPAGNGDPSGEYADDKGSNRHFTTFKNPENSNNDNSEYNIKVEKNNEINTYNDVVKYCNDNNIIIKGGVENNLTTNQFFRSIEQLKNLKNEFNIDIINLGIVPKERSSISLGETWWSRVEDGSITVSFSKKYFGEYDEKELIRDQISARDSGFNAQFTDENAVNYTITHEMGHVLEYQWLNNNGFKKEANKIADEINYGLRIHKYKTTKAARNAYIKKIAQARFNLFEQKFLSEVFALAKEYDSTIPKFTGKIKDAPFISRYGSSEWVEYIAESFANGLLGKPTPIGRATVEIARKWNKGEK